MDAREQRSLRQYYRICRSGWDWSTSWFMPNLPIAGISFPSFYFVFLSLSPVLDFTGEKSANLSAISWKASKNKFKLELLVRISSSPYTGNKLLQNLFHRIKDITFVSMCIAKHSILSLGNSITLPTLRGSYP